MDGTTFSVISTRVSSLSVLKPSQVCSNKSLTVPFDRRRISIHCCRMEPLNVVKLLRKSHDMTSEEIALFIHGMSPEGIHARGTAGLFYLPYDFNLEIPKSQVIFRKGHHSFDLE